MSEPQQLQRDRHEGREPRQQPHMFAVEADGLVVRGSSVDMAVEAMRRGAHHYAGKPSTSMRS
jgi:hypothetical protein